VFVLEHPEKVLACEILKHKANMIAVSECVVEFDNEVNTFVIFLVQEVQNFFFSLNMVDPLLIGNAVLSDTLQSHQLSPYYYQIDRSILALTDIYTRVGIDILLDLSLLLRFL